jgi:hypothetical protein
MSFKEHHFARPFASLLPVLLGHRYSTCAGAQCLRRELFQACLPPVTTGLRCRWCSCCYLSAPLGWHRCAGRIHGRCWLLLDYFQTQLAGFALQAFELLGADLHLVFLLGLPDVRQPML